MAEAEARRERRYPRWVKAVERPTTEFDLEKTDRIAPLGLVGDPESLKKVDVGWQPLGRQIRSGTLGRSLRDSALVAPSEKTRTWWDPKLSVCGIDTNQRQRSRKGD